MTIRRTIGRRTQRPVGIVAPPTPEEIAWRETMAQTLTRVPKGVFRYRTHEEANADWERWRAELVAATTRRCAVGGSDAPLYRNHRLRGPAAGTRAATY